MEVEFKLRSQNRMATFLRKFFKEEGCRISVDLGGIKNIMNGILPHTG